MKLVELNKKEIATVSGGSFVGVAVGVFIGGTAVEGYHKYKEGAFDNCWGSFKSRVINETKNINTFIFGLPAYALYGISAISGGIITLALSRCYNNYGWGRGHRLGGN